VRVELFFARDRQLPPELPIAHMAPTARGNQLQVSEGLTMAFSCYGFNTGQPTDASPGHVCSHMHTPSNYVYVS